MTAAGLTTALASLTLEPARIDRPATTSVPPAPTGRSG
jgi:hypothetical protein